MTEERLNEIARTLGADAAERLDVEATARTVIERLRAEPRRAVWIHETWLRIAAAVVVLVGGAIALQQATQTDAGDHVAHFVADDLSDLSTDQLRDVLGAFDEILNESVAPDSADLHELNTQQLQVILREG